MEIRIFAWLKVNGMDLVLVSLIREDVTKVSRDTEAKRTDETYETWLKIKEKKLKSLHIIVMVKDHVIGIFLDTTVR